MEAEMRRAREALERLLARVQEAQKALEEAQAKLEGLVPMKVVWRKVRCGKETCRCARGTLHGPYPYLVEYREGRKEEKYLGKGWIPPEGMVSPERYREALKELKARREKLEELLEGLDEATRVMERTLGGVLPPSSLSKPQSRGKTAPSG
jgi:DNA repair exonuclease SbcCD ATPase subunit